MYFNNNNQPSSAPNHPNHHGDRDYRPQGRPHLLPNPPHPRNSDRPSFPPAGGRGKPSHHYRGRGKAPNHFKQEQKYRGPYFPQRNINNVPVQAQMPAPWATEPPYLQQNHQMAHPGEMREQWNNYDFPDPNMPSTSNGIYHPGPPHQQYHQGYGQQPVDHAEEGGFAVHHQPDGRYPGPEMRNDFDYGHQNQQGPQNHQSGSQEHGLPTPNPPRYNGLVAGPTAPAHPVQPANIKKEAEEDEVQILGQGKVDHKFSAKNRELNDRLNRAPVAPAAPVAPVALAAPVFNNEAEFKRAFASALNLVFKTFSSAKCLETTTKPRRARASSAEPLTAWSTGERKEVVPRLCSATTSIFFDEAQQPCCSSSLDPAPVSVAASDPLPDSSAPANNEPSPPPQEAIGVNLEEPDDNLEEEEEEEELAHGHHQVDEPQQADRQELGLDMARVAELRGVLEQAAARPPPPKAPKKPQEKGAPKKKKPAPKKKAAPKKVSKKPAPKRKPPQVKKAPLQVSCSNSASTPPPSSEQLFWPNGRPKRSSVKVTE